MIRYACTYLKGDKRFGVDLWGDSPEDVIKTYGPHFDGLDVEGEMRAVIDEDRSQFRKFDVEKRLVYAEVYLPDTEDAHGHSMTAEEIEKMAHGFLKNRRTTSIDVNHDNNVEYGCYMVESFIAREGDTDYMPGAWVGVVKVDNDDLWTSIKNGELTGFSFEGMGYVVEE